jgi:hypothetical protein
VKTAKKAALGALAATVMAMVTPMTAASADQGDTLKGGCSFDTNRQATATNGQNQGVIADLSVSQEASGGPSGATVECWINVNGVAAPGTDIVASGSGVQANSAQISYSAGDTDAVALCQKVTFDDGSSWVGPDGTNPDCPAATSTQIPPQVVIDTLDTVINTLIDVLNTANDALNSVLIADVDPVICPILKNNLGGQTVGPLEINADGDIIVNDPAGLVGKVYDCPPYDPPPAG